nr:hypothetical protein [Tanacetum cinerariifolium]
MTFSIGYNSTQIQFQFPLVQFTNSRYIISSKSSSPLSYTHLTTAFAYVHLPLQPVVGHWYDLILCVGAVAIVKVEEVEEEIGQDLIFLLDLGVSLPMSISWVGSHTKNVNAAVAGSG